MAKDYSLVWLRTQKKFSLFTQRGSKMYRCLPVSLDVAYTVLDNKHVTPVLADMMQNKNGIKLRDGFDYHKQLEVLHKVQVSLFVHEGTT